MRGHTRLLQQARIRFFTNRSVDLTLRLSRFLPRLGTLSTRRVNVGRHALTLSPHRRQRRQRFSITRSITRAQSHIRFNLRNLIRARHSINVFNNMQPNRLRQGLVRNRLLHTFTNSINGADNNIVRMLRHRTIRIITNHHKVRRMKFRRNIRNSTLRTSTTTLVTTSYTINRSIRIRLNILTSLRFT